MILETERLILRPWDESDAEDLFECAKDHRVGPSAGWPVHTSVENSKDIIKAVLEQPQNFAVVLKSIGKVVGCVGLMIGDESPKGLLEDEGELGYWIGVPYWGRGLIPEAVREIQRYGFEDLGLKRIWCGYYEGNEKSKRVQEKCGFIYHHTEEKKLLKLLNEERVEHVSILTIENWEGKKHENPDYTTRRP